MVYIFKIRPLSIYYVIYSSWDGLIWRQRSSLDDKEIKKLIHEKKNIFNCFRRSNNDKQLLDRLKDLQTQLNFFIEKSKEKFCSRIISKLSDNGKSFKTCCSILKSFFIGRKIPCIPLLFKNNEYITDFKKKAELSNLFCNLHQLCLTRQMKVYIQLKLPMMTYSKWLQN